ncbi:hypothetical protein EJB05_04301, partial [Eragrostis curvula]
MTSEEGASRRCWARPRAAASARLVATCRAPQPGICWVRLPCSYTKETEKEQRLLQKGQDLLQRQVGQQHKISK